MAPEEDEEEPIVVSIKLTSSQSIMIARATGETSIFPQATEKTSYLERPEHCLSGLVEADQMLSSMHETETP